MESDIFGQNAVSDQQGTVRLGIMIADDYDPEQRQYRKINPFPYNDKNFSSIHPAISPDGRMLIYASDKPGGTGGTDLYMSIRDNKGSWSAPVSLGSHINTPGEELFPVFIDSRTISFASNGHPGLGGLDVFYSNWNESAGGWGTPAHAGIPVNSSYDDMSLTMYEDGQHGYFASNRPAQKDRDNIYHFFRQKAYVQIQVTDAATGRVVEGASVNLAGGGVRTPIRETATGYEVLNLKPRSDYELAISREGYQAVTMTVSTKDLARIVDTLKLKVALTPEARIEYTAHILDEATRQPIENPLLVISEEGSSRKDTISLATGDVLNTMLRGGTVYHINAVKENYYTNEKIISTRDKPYEVTLSSMTDTILMCRLTIGAVCRIDNIYYDYDKSELRADALPSLQMMLKLMQEYPNIRVQINSHTDCRGTDEYNLKLSQARAESVIRYITGKGVSRKRLVAHGFGEANPAAHCKSCDDECPEHIHQQNRRTEFQVLDL